VKNVVYFGDGVTGVPGIGTTRAIQYLKGKLTGKYLQNIYQSKQIIEKNEKLVKLPFRGTMIPNLEFKKLDLDTIFRVCENYGMYSLLKGKRLETWKIFTTSYV